jgi:hypothetical protein
VKEYSAIVTVAATVGPVLDWQPMSVASMAANAIARMAGSKLG